MMWFFPVNSLISGNFAGDRFVDDCAHHHPVLANRRSPSRRQIGRSCRDFRRLYSRIWVSASVRRFERRFLALRLCIQKFRSRRLWLSAKPARTRPGGIRLLSHRNSGPWARGGSYSGLSPSASNCRLPFSRRIAKPFDTTAQDLVPSATIIGPCHRPLPAPALTSENPLSLES